MNFYCSLGLDDFKRDAVLEVVNEPAVLVLLVLLEAGELLKSGKPVNGEHEVDMLPSVQFACFLNRRLITTLAISKILKFVEKRLYQEKLLPALCCSP